MTLRVDNILCGLMALLVVGMSTSTASAQFQRPPTKVIGDRYEISGDHDSSYATEQRVRASVRQTLASYLQGSGGSIVEETIPAPEPSGRSVVVPNQPMRPQPQPAMQAGPTYPRGVTYSAPFPVAAHSYRPHQGGPLCQGEYIGPARASHVP